MNTGAIDRFLEVFTRYIDSGFGAVGLDAGRPILQSISGLIGFASFFENFIQIIVLLFAWAIVLISFFILAIQLFVSLIEFKLSTLCGFVPFGRSGSDTGRN